jgi:hypothetical protein
MAAISRRHGAEVSLLLGRRGEGGGRYAYVPREDTIVLARKLQEPWSLVPLGQQRVAPFCTRHRAGWIGAAARSSLIMELYC